MKVKANTEIFEEGRAWPHIEPASLVPGSVVALFTDYWLPIPSPTACYHQQELSLKNKWGVSLPHLTPKYETQAAKRVRPEQLSVTESQSQQQQGAGFQRICWRDPWSVPTDAPCLSQHLPGAGRGYARGVAEKDLRKHLTPSPHPEGEALGLWDRYVWSLCQPCDWNFGTWNRWGESSCWT